MKTAELISHGMEATERKSNGYFLCGVSNHRIAGVVKLVFELCSHNYSKGRSVVFIFEDGSSLTAKCWPNNVYSCRDWVIKN